TIGVPGKASTYQGGEPFNRCTHVAFSPQGDIYVSDGYGNSRVHKYSPHGKLLLSWGESGSDPGQFNIVHNIVTDKEGWVYVADRENNRVQVFNGNGKYETQWNNMHRPCALYMDTTKADPLCYVGELGPGLGVNIKAPNLGNRVDVYDKHGKRLARLGDIFAGEKPGQFIAPHGIAIDSRGDIYVGEVSWTIMGQRLQPPRELRSLQKLKKVN
ncbi:MAG: peptidyl-alpha-hydroxyglycine alpha-amidating lyase family protein, partial [Candidatus Binatia bacterium]